MASPSLTHSPAPATNVSNSPQLQFPLDSTRHVKDENPFGLEILYEPQTRPAKLVQIIFVHGLGGSKRGTWTHSKTNYFWPTWLHEEKGLENVRIATFGYNSNFNILAPNTNLSIPTFANQLLFNMNQLNYRNGSVSYSHILS